jgi:hypothetical protein
LPLRISADSVRIDGKEFKARDAAVQLIYPNPANAERYVWIFAGTSPGGMYFTEANPQRQVLWDYAIADGHVSAFKRTATPEELRVVSGVFDYNWRFASTLQVVGDVTARTKGRQLRRPDPNFRLDAKALANYVGRYQITGGQVVELVLDKGKLMALAGGPAEMIAESDTVFHLPAVNVRVFFERDAAGKITGFTGSGDSDFEGKKLD